MRPMRRLLVLSVLVLALVILLVPGAIAVIAMFRGDVETALAVVRPLLLIPCVFLLVGLWFSVRGIGAKTAPRPPAGR